MENIMTLIALYFGIFINVIDFIIKILSIYIIFLGIKSLKKYINT